MRLQTVLTWTIFLFFGLISLVSCTKREEVTVQRLDQQLFAGKSKDSIRAFLNRNPSVSQLYFNANGAGNDTALVNELYTRVNDPELNVLYQQVQTEFGDMNDVKDQLSEAFTNIKKEFPDFRPPRIVTMVSGFDLGTDLIVSDTLVIIGLDYFAGPKAKYRPQGPNFPQYILRRYQKEYIAPAIVFALSDKYNATNRADQSMLADMIYYGKGYVFTKTMLPDVDNSFIIGYSDQQLTETYNAQDLVWAHFIDNQLLYQTNPAIKQRYLNERPFTAEIGPRCPGAIGRWVGWRIVSRYYDEKSGVSIQDLMANADAKQIFQQSGYRGQIDEE